MVLFRLIKTLEYETANPGQDFDEHEAAVFQPTEDAATAEEVRRPTGQEISTGVSRPLEFPVEAPAYEQYPSDQLGTPMVPTATNYSHSPSAYNSSPDHSNEPRHHSPAGTPHNPTKQNGYTHRNKHVQHDSLITSNESHSSNYTQQTFTLQQASRAGVHAHEPHQQDVYHEHNSAPDVDGSFQDRGRPRRNSALRQVQNPTSEGMGLRDGCLDRENVYPPMPSGGHRHFAHDPAYYHGSDTEDGMVRSEGRI